MRASRPLVLALPLLALSACGSSSGAPPSASVPSLVATHSVLGAIVSDLVGDRAKVRVLIPNGIDPHEWEPSARDVEAINKATLVIGNGLGLEESLDSILDESEAPVFVATESLTPRSESPDLESDDPHFWTNPLAVAEVVEHLGEELMKVGLDVVDRAVALIADLNALDAEVRESLSEIPVEDRVMITGHVSMAYFAAHYGFELLGSIVPSLSSSAEATAANLTDLKEAIAAEGVSVIFAELGANDDVVEALAKETGVRVVVVSSHLVPDDNTYRSFLLQLASEVRDALTA